MNRMKKFLSVLLVGALFSMALTGCSSGTSEQTTKDSGSAATQMDPDKTEQDGNDKGSGEIVTLKVAMVSTSDQSGADEVEAAANEILKEYGVAIDITFINFGSWQQQTNLLLTGGSDSVDVLPLLTTPLTTYVNNGQVLELNELLEQYGQDIKEQFTQEQLNGGKVAGKLYGITTSRDLAASYGIYMRKDILEETGIDPATISKVEDLEEVFVKVKELHPEMYGLFGSQTGSVEAWGWDRINDGNQLGVVMDSGQADEIVNLYEQPEYETFVRLMRDWHQKGYIMADALSNTETSENLMKSGKLFAAFNNLKPGFAEQQERATGYEIEVIEFIPAYATTQNIQGLTWGIAAASTHPEEAMILLNQMYSNPELSNILVNGIEGESYVYIDDTKELIDFPEGVDAANTPYTNLGWAWPNQFITPVWSPNPTDYWDTMREFNETATPSKALGFAPDTSTITNEVTACTNVVTKYNYALMTGSVDVDETLPKFQEELRNAGIDKIIEEKTSQYEQWKLEQ